MIINIPKTLKKNSQNKGLFSNFFNYLFKIDNNSDYYSADYFVFDFEKINSEFYINVSKNSSVQHNMLQKSTTKSVNISKCNSAN